MRIWFRKVCRFDPCPWYFGRPSMPYADTTKQREAQRESYRR
jgi:hypothetical protein